MTDKLIELAKDCEAATGPDREIDTLIGYAVDLPTEDAQLPHYTASLDAALTLSDNFLRGLSLHQRPNPDMGGRDWIASAAPYRAAARSWPLAVCAAALRARADQ
jgi:hypothetical protein